MLSFPWPIDSSSRHPQLWSLINHLCVSCSHRLINHKDCHDLRQAESAPARVQIWQARCRRPRNTEARLYRSAELPVNVLAAALNLVDWKIQRFTPRFLQLASLVMSLNLHPVRRLYVLPVDVMYGDKFSQTSKAGGSIRSGPQLVQERQTKK